jgi:hypothetical protein
MKNTPKIPNPQSIPRRVGCCFSIAFISHLPSPPPHHLTTSPPHPTNLTCLLTCLPVLACFPLCTCSIPFVVANSTYFTLILHILCSPLSNAMAAMQVVGGSNHQRTLVPVLCIVLLLVVLHGNTQRTTAASSSSGAIAPQLANSTITTNVTSATQLYELYATPSRSAGTCNSSNSFPSILGPVQCGWSVECACVGIMDTFQQALDMIAAANDSRVLIDVVALPGTYVLAELKLDFVPQIALRYAILYCHTYQCILLVD